MRLTNEAAQHFLIFTFKHFNGHLAVKVWVVPLVDISHSASTHQPVQFIATKCFPLQSYHKLSPSTSAKQLSGRNKSESLQSFFGYIVYKTVHIFFCYVNQSSCAIKQAPTALATLVQSQYQHVDRVRWHDDAPAPLLLLHPLSAIAPALPRSVHQPRPCRLRRLSLHKPA